MDEYKKVLFKEFIEELKNEVDEFEKYWETQQKTLGKEIFPDKLLAGDWYEQFIAYNKNF